MELRWLQDFLMVAETGNFTRAAEKRNTSQAAFSRRIKSLEAWLGFDLIGGTPEDFAKLLRDEQERWAPVVKKLGIKVD